MHKRIAATVATAVLGASVLVGCSDGDQTPPSSSGSNQSQDSNDTGSSGNGMDHPMDGGPAPAGIENATNPKYPVGTEVKLTADHMDGMNGAKAKIVGAYDTYTYSVNYTPTDGGKAVTDHKWVVQQEVKNAGQKRLADGTKVTLEAEHMQGMKGTTATIASSTDETVYMVDYEAGGMKMTNHKWVTESEIQPAS